MKDIVFDLRASVCAHGSVVGAKEHHGPLGNLFDMHDEDDKFGQKTWEQAESEMQRRALGVALKKWGRSADALGALFAGDLLNQCVGSAYGLIDYQVPYFGLYGACSTAALGMMLGAILVSAGQVRYAAAVTSSHNTAAERQYRTPVEYGAQRTPTAQWTVTGASAFILGRCDHTDPSYARVSQAMPGIPIEMGIRDAANMGAAMAPAAVDTLERYLAATGTAPEDFDAIVTGDLGWEGSAIFCDLLHADGIDVDGKHADCGAMIYSRHTQDTHAGGSGCGCSGVVMSAYFLPKLASGEIKDMLLIGTGAMMSPDALKQGRNIPAIGHLVRLKGGI
ncbi:MAG: stage V sporulation protein AD [Clostridia bacterium]|nr:stage V sporulation protein AD [Clostridia bacterium]MBQ5793601.1 stage V sporulation protein AD [Clostridia bacterium]